MNLSYILGLFSSLRPAVPARAVAALFAAAACLWALTVPAYLIARSWGAELGRLEAKSTELQALSAEYAALKAKEDAFERKLSLSKASGVMQAMDEVGSALGIKGKLKSVKALGRRELKDSVGGERAEVRFEKLSMNELVNLFARMEGSPMLLAVSGAAMKKSFDNPELLDLTMTVELFTR